MSARSVKIVSILILLCVVLTSISMLPISDLIVARADTSIKAFDKTNVLVDLTSAVVGSEAFDIDMYKQDADGDIQILSVVEYGYSYHSNLMADYGIYIYIFNPKATALNTFSLSNKISIATSYNANGSPDDYEKYNIKLVSKSAAPYANLFYKFRIVDRKSAKGTTIEERVNRDSRRYDISGIELVLSEEKTTADDFGIGGTYMFSGYAKGLGANPETISTLQCEVEDLETVKLDVRHTYYRTETSSKGAGYQNQLDSVYFTVPNELFAKYGQLQRIKAEWYEYKTTDIIVTTNSDFSNKIKYYLGIRVPSKVFNGEPIGSIYNSDMGYSLAQGVTKQGDMWAANWGWNLGDKYFHTPTSSIQYLFLTNNLSGYDPYRSVVSTGGVESSELYKHILNYKNTWQTGYVPIKNKQISADLFTADIDNYRKVSNEMGKIQKGYSYYDFDASLDLHHLQSWQSTNPSFWENWQNWGFLNTIFGNLPVEQSRSVSPIQVLENSDFLVSDKTMSDNLLINYNDIGNFRLAQTNAVINQEKLVLFHFATSDYFSQDINIMQLGKGTLGADKVIKDQAYRAWGSVFLDFDIIQLTFSKDGEYFVIPAVSNPIDIIPDITPPFKLPDLAKNMWPKIMGLIMLLILVVVFIAFFPTLMPLIVNLIVFIITLPIRLIKAIIKLFRKE